MDKHQEHIEEEAESYFPISPLMLFPDTHGKFAVYLRQGEDYVLYTRQGELFTEEHRKRMHTLGVAEVFVRSGHKERYQRYVMEHMGDFLSGDDVPVHERAAIFYDTSVGIVKDAFSTRLPKEFSRERFKAIENLVLESVKFLSRKDALRALGRLITHDYKVYRHSVNVFVFTVAVMSAMDMGQKVMVDTGVGAMLHDIGKQRIPREILDRGDKLTHAERERLNSHPVQGVAMCANLPLSSEVIGPILFHHERMDGKGFPTGLSYEEIPLPVRVVSAVNVYENLITGNPSRPGMTPFQALKVLSDEGKGAFDPDVVKRLIMVLSGARIVAG